MGALAGRRASPFYVYDRAAELAITPLEQSPHIVPQLQVLPMTVVI